MAHKIPAAITVTEADVVKRLKEGFRLASLPSGGLEAADGRDVEARAYCHSAITIACL